VVQLPGEAATATAAAQQLQQQAAGLLEHLQQVLLYGIAAEGIKPSSTEQSVAAVLQSGVCRWCPALQELQKSFSGDLPQQLQQFGAEVCHQLPVSLWCCNPCCTNLQQ
jgi:hypothetical protein